MTDYPAPDLRDSGGRAKRIVLALVIGVACAAGAYALTTWMAREDLAKSSYAIGTYSGGARKFVAFMTALAFVAGLGLTLVIANARAKAKWRKSRDVPVAKVV